MGSCGSSYYDEAGGSDDDDEDEDEDDLENDDEFGPDAEPGACEVKTVLAPC